MALVVTTIPIHTQRYVQSTGSTSNMFDSSGSTDSTAYLVFSSQNEMKTLTYPDRIRNEFDLYLQYAEAKTLGAINTDFDEFDNYLGSLGV